MSNKAAAVLDKIAQREQLTAAKSAARYREMILAGGPNEEDASELQSLMATLNITAEDVKADVNAVARAVKLRESIPNAPDFATAEKSYNDTIEAQATKVRAAVAEMLKTARPIDLEFIYVECVRRCRVGPFAGPVPPNGPTCEIDEYRRVMAAASCDRANTQDAKGRMRSELSELERDHPRIFGDGGLVASKPATAAGATVEQPTTGGVIFRQTIKVDPEFAKSDREKRAADQERLAEIQAERSRPMHA